jgi:hypothetical protein
VEVAMIDGSVLISEPQGAVHHAYNMIRLNTMRRQIQRMLNDKVGSLKRLPPRYALALQTSSGRSTGEQETAALYYRVLKQVAPEHPITNQAKRTLYPPLRWGGHSAREAE